MKNKKMSIMLVSGIVIVVSAILIYYFIQKTKSQTNPPKKPSNKPISQNPLISAKDGSVSPSEYGGVFARDGFGNKVDWWFLIKLPVKMMSPDQLQNLRLLPKDYLPDIPHSVYAPSMGGMETNYLKGYLKTGLDPGTQFIQNWAPQEHVSINVMLYSDDQTNTTYQMEHQAASWLGVPKSFCVIKKNKELENTYLLTVTTPANPKYAPNADPADKVPAVLLWRAWLRIIQVVNLENANPTLKKKLYKDFLDITSQMKNTSPIFLEYPRKSIKIDNKILNVMNGQPYDFHPCGNPSVPSYGMASFSGIAPTKDGIGVSMCAHCNNNGNDPDRNVWSGLPCDRVDNSGNKIKCWSPKQFLNLTTRISTLFNNNEKLDGLVRSIALFIASQEPGQDFIKDLTAKVQRIHHALADDQKNNKGKLSSFNPAGEPVCGWDTNPSSCLSQSQAHSTPGKEKYTPYKKQTSNLDFIPYSRNAECEGSKSEVNPMNYFLPSWAKIQAGKGKLKTRQNYKATAKPGGGIALTKNGKGRGSAVCYVYADSNTPKLTYFRDVKSLNNNNKDLLNLMNLGKPDKLDPLGQKGFDPVSMTLEQLFLSYKNSDTHWSFWTDQMYSAGDGYIGTKGSSSKVGGPPFDISDPYSQNQYGDGVAEGTTYPHKGAGCSAPGAHSKGALCYDGKSGFWLSSSIPMYPDFSFSNLGVAPKLGCQLDNNVSFAQHMFCCSLEQNAMDAMMKSLKDVMACGLESPTCKVDSISGFNYGYGLDTNKFNDENVYRCSSLNKDDDEDTLKEANSFKYDPKGVSKMKIFQKNNKIGYNNNKKIVCSSNAGCTPQSQSIDNNKTAIVAIAKAPADNRPPWVVVSQFLQTDLSVTGWWDTT